MLKVKQENQKYCLTINGKDIEGTHSKNWTWAYDRNIIGFSAADGDSQNHCDLYALIRKMEIKEFPNNVQFDIFNAYNGDDYQIIKELPVPFNKIDFLIRDKLIVKISSTYSVDDWRNKYTYNIYMYKFKEKIKYVDDIKILDSQDYDDSSFSDEYSEFVLETEIDYCKSIEDGAKLAINKFKPIAEKVAFSLSEFSDILNIIDEWKKNNSNASEEFWHNFLKKNFYLISLCFTTPNIIFNDKAYVGGKNINNQDGNIIDFIYKNHLSKNLSLIEIKTPKTALISNKYRNTYSISKDLAGATIQLLAYKDSVTKDFHYLGNNSTETFEIFNPRCLLIIGSLKYLTDNQKKAFELYRNELKNIEIITYDELFEKLLMILDNIKDNYVA